MLLDESQKANEKEEDFKTLRDLLKQKGSR